MEGFFNRVLHVDLEGRRSWKEEIPDAVFQEFLGGKGLATYLLLRDLKPGLDPLSPDNILIFATGPLTDTLVFGSSRYGVFTKSPLTGLYLESYAGGDVAEFISRTGYDAIVLHGASRKPIFLEISDREIKFHDASHIWGMETYTAEDAIRQELAFAKVGVAVIGPAGENLVRFALIENNYWRSIGRGGAGAVLGSKKVKGIAFHGTQKREVAHPDILMDFWKEIGKKGPQTATAIAYKKFGTPMVVQATNSVGAFPTQYWAKGTFEKWKQISADALLEQCEVKAHACPKCFMACGKISKVKEGRHAGLTIEGPEYETIDALGGICLVDDIREIIYLNDFCDRLGIDTITAGNLAGFTIEASRRKDIGYKLEYGDVDGIAQLFYMMARREGIGAILAEGVKHAAKAWNLEELAVHVKGMDPPGYEPRVLKGMALAYATSDRGACHLRSTFYKAELSGAIPPEQVEGKARTFIDWEDRLTIQDCLILCRFFRDLYLWDEYAILIKGCTGMELSRQEIQALAGRVLNLAREFNLREGMRVAEDTLPPRLLLEKLLDSGKGITSEELSLMLEEYYSLRGWC
jgi:aldehyde:ferredoxin oxidoreductase